MDHLAAPPDPGAPWRPPPLEYGPWGPPGYQHPRGTPSLVLGLLSVTVFTPLGPFAWAMSRRALREVDAAPVVVVNRGQLVAAQAMGVVASALLAVMTVIVVAAVLGVLLLAV
ncbi:DUF4190 domain-containing protein [Serinicoccus chungangensis]|uniref:DUF4190 domain-containing protein n=1 Tax=Serinicoccus chungangensis TaxID=767452 RepID=UPI00137A116D|nr:DUF4190 domain-containing protein [Serinicoccus chungangensis]